MYWPWTPQNGRHTINKIIADRARIIVAVTGIGSNPCQLEHLKPTLHLITLNEMEFGLKEQPFMSAKALSMPAPSQAWGTKAL